MSPRRCSIHLGSANSPVLLALVHLLFNSLVTVYRVFSQALNVHAKLFVLAHLEATLGSLRWVNEQILHLFIVDLNHGELDLVLLIRGSTRPNTLKDLRARDRHDSDIGSVTNLRNIK